MARPPKTRTSHPDPSDRLEPHVPFANDPARPAQLPDQLANWDELSEQDLVHLGTHPDSRGKLQHLRQAQAWLEDCLLDQQDCPTAEELFSLGMPFAGGALHAERQVEIREHLKLCQDCAQELHTLATPPPSPLDVSAPELPNDARDRATASPAPLRRLRSILIAAAALMLVWLFGGRDLFSDPDPIAASVSGWPNTTTLRGSSDTAWLAPRGRLLARSEGGTWQGQLRWLASKDAQAHRIVITQSDGSAFDRGSEVLNLPQGAAPKSLEVTLPAGFYTVELFATVFGMESPQLSSEFQVIESPETLAQMRALSGVSKVNFLHNNGWLSDAMVEAMALPESPQRARYIKAMESR